MQEEIDLRAAINAISDVIQNRPRPLREFDQIHMKAGDMVLQSELVARWANGKRLIFVGDGDAISVGSVYLRQRGIVNYGPSRVTVLDFDERVVSAINRFAEKERIESLSAKLYNCLDLLPELPEHDCFYTNPPWGASNSGRSVIAFARRGMEAIRYDGDGMIVIADDDDLEWPREVLSSVQRFAVDQGFCVSRMMPKLHSYHLDDNPELKSCNLVISSFGKPRDDWQSEPISDPAELEHFYGRGLEPRVRYVRERKRVDYGMAHDSEYTLELLGNPR